MAVLPFSEYRPDLNDLNKAYSSNILNAVPQADGYGPVKEPNAFSLALGSRVYGLFFARMPDGSIKVFAGTSIKLYTLDNTTLSWEDVSVGGTSYTALSTGANWQFAQFNDYVIAVQANTDVQVFQLGVSTDFTSLSGSPPRAAYVSVVNRFLVLSGLASYPRRVHWSGLNDITQWTSGTNLSDYQDLPDGGNVTRVIGGEFGIIFQDSAIRRMVYTTATDIVFQIDKIAKDIGDAAPYGVTEADGKAYFYSQKGFYAVSGDGGLQPIGRERVDRTFARDADLTKTNLIQAVASPNAHLVMWAFTALADNVDYWTRIFAYDFVLDRWARIDVSGDYIASLARPGLTLESLDQIGATAITNATNNGSGLIRLTLADTSPWVTGDQITVGGVGGVTNANNSSTNPYWVVTVVSGTTLDLDGSTFSGAYTSGGYISGSVDADPVTSFDDVTSATLAQLGCINTDHQLAYFTGDNLEATLETAEQSSVARRMFVRGFFPITDAATVSGSTARRENLYTTPSYTTAASVNGQGFIPQRASTRHARAKITIPHAEAWTYATGVEPDAVQEGRR